nr:MAG TPA: hypothetical protein [Bacteriophage sp.]
MCESIAAYLDEVKPAPIKGPNRAGDAVKDRMYTNGTYRDKLVYAAITRAIAGVFDRYPGAQEVTVSAVLRVNYNDRPYVEWYTTKITVHGVPVFLRWDIRRTIQNDGNGIYWSSHKCRRDKSVKEVALTVTIIGGHMEETTVDWPADKITATVNRIIESEIETMPI